MSLHENVKKDLFMSLSTLTREEVLGLRAALRAGKINGESYFSNDGASYCFIGHVAAMRGVEGRGCWRGCFGSDKFLKVRSDMRWAAWESGKPHFRILARTSWEVALNDVKNDKPTKQGVARDFDDALTEFILSNFPDAER